ncbi:MAG: hypothetical protein HZB46_15820 [Solirubrobacterales bacterium]|nr:hypothetical protein [Solirubrobacterales bacterium]
MTGRRTEHLVVAALAMAAVVFWAAVPTYPNYDAYYHLVWGRELLDGMKPTFEAYQAPTEHPLYLAVCALVGLVGEHGDRVLVLLTALSHVAFTWAVYRLGTAIWDRRAGLMAALLAGSSFALLLYAARAYVDEPFLALVLWAAAFEAEGRRRAVLPLLFLAGLLRPEAWLLAGGLWLWRRMPPRELPWVLAAPLVWCAVDLWVTGDPLYSFHATSELADELNRNKSLSEVPGDFVRFLADTAREPVAVAAAIGVVVAWRRREGRAVYVPLALFAAGTFTFFATSIAGLSVLPRYLTVPAVALCLPAGYLVTRTRWLLGLAIAAGLAFVVVRADAFDRLATELRFIRGTHDDLVGVLHTREVTDGLRCGPVTLPNYRLVPDTRWILDLPRERVGSRSARQRDHGVALLLLGEKLLRRYGFADGASPITNAPPPGFERAVRHGRFVAYTSCP